MFDDELSHPWSRVRAEVRRTVPESAWRLWLEGLNAREREGDVLVVEAPAHRLSWICERYGRVLDACAQAVLGPGAGVRLEEAGTQGATHAGAAPSRALETPLDPRLSFESFVIGDANRFAHAAALAVAEAPGGAYNPLLICGSPGLGKTHLLHAIGNYVRDAGDGLRVRYTTVEAFTNAFVGALQGGRMEAFKAAYRDVDVLLVDDVQFLASKVRTEQEFFHTFNALHAARAQLVLTSDRTPRDLEGLEARLRERFEAGLVCDVQPPDFATRLAILRQRVQADGHADVEPAALGVIAERVVGHLRAIEGALIRVVAFGSLTGRPVTAALAREVLDGLYPELRPRTRTVRDIQERVAVACGVSVEEITSARRSARVAWARQVAMFLAREITGESLPAIGKAFGGRSHTTVLHACKRTTERTARDPEADALVRRLVQELER